MGFQESCRDSNLWYSKDGSFSKITKITDFRTAVLLLGGMQFQGFPWYFSTGKENPGDVGHPDAGMLYA